MKIWDIELTDLVLESIAQHGEREFPNEACGVVLGPTGGTTLSRVVPLENVQDKYHRLDPEAFPRTARDAFRMNELERIRVLDEASETGLDERILYHSHCDAGAYFSPEDRAMAVQDGIELLPGVVHIVVSIRDGRHTDTAAYRYDKERETFEEHRLGPDATGLPDLTLRAMEGREAARPLRPVGGTLSMRRIDRTEAARLEALADEGFVRIKAPQTLADLSCFGAGHYSPLEGFMTKADVRAVLDRGRLQAGAEWRVPVVLEVPRRDVHATLSAGAILRLVDESDALVALIALTDVATTEATVILGGPLYVVADAADDAAESRARVLRSGAKRVLAIPDDRVTDAKNLDLTSFDLVLCATPVDGADTAPFVATTRSPWLLAAMAQNQGATHVWVEDTAARKVIRESLDVEAWP